MSFEKSKYFVIMKDIEKYVMWHHESELSFHKRFFICLMVFNATFDNIWWWALLVEKTGETTNLSQVTVKLYPIMLYTSPWSRFELTTSQVKNMLSGCELIDTENISLPSQNMKFVGEWASHNLHILSSRLILFQYQSCSHSDDMFIIIRSNINTDISIFVFSRKKLHDSKYSKDASPKP